MPKKKGRDQKETSSLIDSSIQRFVHSSIKLLRLMNESSSWHVKKWFVLFLKRLSAQECLIIFQNRPFYDHLKARLTHEQFLRKKGNPKWFLRYRILLDSAYFGGFIKSTAVYFRAHTHRSMIQNRNSYDTNFTKEIASTYSIH